jgi:hypothetical protein
MTRRYISVRTIVAACAVSVVVLSFPTRSCGAPTGSGRAGTGEEMISILRASGPHASLGDQARVWERFTGTWDCDFTFFLEDGSVKHSPGELEFGWILDGLAIQDLWIVYPDQEGQERDIGTSIRFYDDKVKAWRVVFVNPKYNAITTVQGGVEGGRIVLRGEGAKGTQLRWSFNDIKENSFTWRGEKSHDAGKTWKLAEEHHMRRRSATQGSR